MRTNFPKNRDIERVEYWQGQLLRSSDLSAQEDSGDQLRWWHNRSLHNAYGIALGLGIAVKDRVLTIGCGVAYDAHGRELILPVPVGVQLPSVKVAPGGDPPSPRYLILRARSTCGSKPSGDCPACEGSAVSIAWIQAKRFRGTSGVPIAYAEADAAGLFTADEDFEPPRSRPIARPHIGSGFTPPGGTVWKAWREVIKGSFEPERTVGIQTEVDTSAAGFASVPVYIAELQMRDRLTASQPAICHIYNAKPDSFIFRVWLPSTPLRERIAYEPPKAKVRDTNEARGNKIRVHFEDPPGFIVGDFVKIVGKPPQEAEVVVVSPKKDDHWIEISPPLDGLDEDDVSLRLAFLPSLTRISGLFVDQKLPPGTNVELTGKDRLSGAPVSYRVTVTVLPDKTVIFGPSAFQPMAIGDTAKEAPQVFVISPARTDIPLVAQDLGWQVCWVGAVCDEPREIACDEPACQVDVEEVC